jgi:hypothetical protein
MAISIFNRFRTGAVQTVEMRRASRQQQQLEQNAALRVGTALEHVRYS